MSFENSTDRLIESPLLNPPPQGEEAMALLAVLLGTLDTIALTTNM
jgi:hypothetical protein